MKHDQRFHARQGRSPAAAWYHNSAYSRLVLLSLLASATKALADDYTALNELAEAKLGESAQQAFQNLPSLFTIPLSTISTVSVDTLLTDLNNGLKMPEYYIGTIPLRVNVISGYQPFTSQQVTALQSWYENHEAPIYNAQLLAMAYADIKVNLQTIDNIVLAPPKSLPSTPPGLLVQRPLPPGNPITQVAANDLYNMDLELMKTADEENGAAAKTQSGGNDTLAGLHLTSGVNAYFEQSYLTGGRDIELYGMNLDMEAAADRLKGWLAVPLQWATYSSSTYMTYGVDAGAKYELIRDSGLYAGAHAGYMANDGDGSLYENNWQAGPFVGYTYKFGKRFSLSTGVLADYVQPQSSADTWIAGFGANFGVRLTDHIALNTYYAYWRNLAGVQSYIGVDWHDVGMELAYTLGKSWRLVVGGRTSLGYEGYDYDYQVHLGADWMF